MKAEQHTQRMLMWLRDAGVERLDLALLRHGGAMVWHHSKTHGELPLPWTRAMNVHRSEVYIRPSRHGSWPLVFLDDLAPSLAAAIARKYGALVVATSPQGGCHVWLKCSEKLCESKRALAQRWLARRTGADLASTSGEHLGRLAGFKNWKRSGVWVNTIATSKLPPWDPSPALHEPSEAKRRRRAPNNAINGVDTSPSGRDWAWVCAQLESGGDPQAIYNDLAARVISRRGPDSERYARRTVERALSHIHSRRG